MKSLLSLAIAILFLALPVQAELFISEYIEGSSNNKAIEIYNPGPGSVSTDNYDLQYYFNGNGTAGLTISLAGFNLAAGEVLVVAHSSAAAAILAQADITSGSGFFNGDDAVALNNSGSPVDVVGQIGFDPGSAWVCGVGSGSTANNTLRRDPSVCAGDTNGADVFDPCVNLFIGFASDTFDGLGSHTAQCGTTATEDESWGNVKSLFR